MFAINSQINEGKRCCDVHLCAGSARSFCPYRVHDGRAHALDIDRLTRRIEIAMHSTAPALRQLHASDGNTEAHRPSKRPRVTLSAAECEPKAHMPKQPSMPPPPELLLQYTEEASASVKTTVVVKSRPKYPDIKTENPF